MCPLCRLLWFIGGQSFTIAIQLNTLQVGYVSTCRLLNGSGLMGWWTIIPLTYYSHSTELHCKWDMCPLADY